MIFTIETGTRKQVLVDGRVVAFIVERKLVDSDNIEMSLEKHSDCSEKIFNELLSSWNALAAGESDDS